MTTHTLYLLPLGQLGSVDPTTGAVRFNQVPGYLLRTAAGRLIVIDTGNPASLVGAADAAPWFPALRNATTPEDDVVRRFGELGSRRPRSTCWSRPTSTSTIAAGMRSSPTSARSRSCKRPIWQRLAPTQRYDPALWDRPGLRYEGIDGDLELEPGVRLLATPGHAVGHQSALSTPTPARSCWRSTPSNT